MKVWGEYEKGYKWWDGIPTQGILVCCSLRIGHD